MEKVTVYDRDNIEIGKTYERRARQLVLKNRASWLDDNRSAIVLVSEESEEPSMEIYNNNGKVPDAICTDDLREEGRDSELLMYLAKRNVQSRKNFLMHLIIYPISFIALALITDGFWRGGIRIEFYAGVYVTWGVIIAHKFFILMRSWLSGRGFKADPVKTEYERLKSMGSRKFQSELKRL